MTDLKRLEIAVEWAITYRNVYDFWYKVMLQLLKERVK